MAGESSSRLVATCCAARLKSPNLDCCAVNSCSRSLGETKKKCKSFVGGWSVVGLGRVGSVGIRWDRVESGWIGMNIRQFNENLFLVVIL